MNNINNAEHKNTSISNEEHIYSIKDSLTPELKRLMKSTIDKSGKRMKEMGFSLCKNRDTGKLFAGHICEGEKCSVSLKDSLDLCFKLEADIQGGFHTHPRVRTENLKNIRKGKPVMSVYDIRKKFEDEDKQIFQEMGIDMKPVLILPSFPDVLSMIDISCKTKNPKTTCVGSDINPDSIECWTVKTHMLNKKICDRAKEEIEPENLEKYKKEAEKKFAYAPIKPWVIPLFNREIIEINK